MVRWPLEIYGSRISPVEPLLRNVQLPRKRHWTARIRFAAACSPPVYGRSNMVGLAGSRNATVPNYGELQRALSDSACCWPPSRITALIEQDASRISFQFGTGTARAPQLFAAHSVGAAVAEWALL